MPSPPHPRVSVVIPVYNAARFIGTALRSVFAQTFTDFDVIVVDDGSDDHEDLQLALAPWAQRIRYLRQPNGGPAKARNTAIARASGELVAFLDADDEWLPEKLALQVAYYDRHPDTGLLHSAMTDEPKRFTGIPGPPRNLFCELFHGAFFVNTLTVMVPRRVLEELGGFDERREVHIEDYDLWLRIAARHPIGYISVPVASHRPGGFMSSQVERTYAAQALVMDKNRPLCAVACAAHRSSPARCDRLRRHVLHRDWGYDRLQSGNSKAAREQLALAVACKPWDAYTLALYFSTYLSNEWRARVRRVVAVGH